MTLQELQEMKTVPPTSIRTITGGWIDLANPKLEDIVWEDIIRTLPKVNRFGGHTTFPYSVAQHSWLASVLVEGPNRPNKLAALLHDAAEAYTNDIVRPMKKMFPEIKERLELPLQRLILTKAGLPPDLPPEVKEVDNKLLLTELRDLHPLGLWTEDHDLIPETGPFDRYIIRPMPFYLAEELFRKRLYQLL